MFINNICILASDSLAYLYRGDMSNLGIVMTRTSNFVNYAAQYVLVVLGAHYIYYVVLEKSNLENMD